MVTPPVLRHQAFFYRSPAEYVDRITDFTVEGLAKSESVLVALPALKGTLIRRALAGLQGAEFVDMANLGRNPSRIIPAVTEFLRDHGDRPVRFIGEPIWSGRADAEIAEATRHEALINLALASLPVSILCPYDLDALPPSVLLDSWRNHSEVIVDGLVRRSTDYTDPLVLAADSRWPLAEIPEVRLIAERDFDELTGLRREISHRAADFGLSIDRVSDFVLSVNEVASNSILYGGGAGSFSLWQESSRGLVCEVRDQGWITDPLVGHRPPGPGTEARGLWLVNQLCDLVEIRSSPEGSRVRLHVGD